MYNENVTEKVAEWLNRKFLEWQLTVGNKQTVRSFADFLDVKETSLSGWMRGVSNPTGDNLEKIGVALGLRIYDLVGEARPDARIAEMQAIYGELSEEDQEALIEEIRKWAAARGRTVEVRPLPRNSEE